MLKFTGGGFGGALPLIPSRDLDDDEVARYGGEAYLLATGLYERAGTPTAKPKSKARTEINLGDSVSDDESTLAGKPPAARKEH